MKLKDCTYGTLVVDQNGNGSIGMIVGITNNCSCADYTTRREQTRAIPLVQWAHGATTGVHYSYLEIFKTF